jgi:hypothetical protein
MYLRKVLFVSLAFLAVAFSLNLFIGCKAKVGRSDPSVREIEGYNYNLMNSPYLNLDPEEIRRIVREEIQWRSQEVAITTPLDESEHAPGNLKPHVPTPTLDWWWFGLENEEKRDIWMMRESFKNGPPSQIR